LGFGDVQAAYLSLWTGVLNDPHWTRFAIAVLAKTRGGAPPQAPPQPQPQQQAGGWQAPPPQQQASGWSNQGGAQASGELSPIAYIQKCLRLYVDGKGRARRREYGWFFAFAFVAGLVAGILDIMIGGFDPYTGQARSFIFVLIAGAALIAPTVSVASRRAHDFGQTGWLAALVCIPYIGWIAAIVFIFIPGQGGPNQYGPDPKAAAGV
jgi:uncharacterized membrane protein YhaH (DUF805 family)